MRKLVFFLCIVVLALQLSACSDNSSSSQNPVTSSTTPATAVTLSTTPATAVMSTVTLSGSWPSYKDIGSLKRAANVIISGKIVKNNPSIVSTPTSPTSRSIPYTDSVISLNEVLYDPHNLVQNSPSLIVRQTGGIIDNTVFVVENNPLFKVDEQVILFLELRSLQESYVVSPSGRFAVEKGIVRTFSEDGLVFPKPETMTSFITKIKNTPTTSATSVAAQSSQNSITVLAGENFNPVQLYQLRKTNSILVKGGPKAGLVNEDTKVKLIQDSLDKSSLALPSVSYSASSSEEIYIVFELNTGTTVGFAYNYKLDTLTTGSEPNLVKFAAPIEWHQIFGL